MEVDRILRLPQVIEIAGLSRTRIYHLIAKGEFPAPIKLSERAVGWRHSDIQEWIRTRALATAARKTNHKAAECLREA